MTLVPSTRPGAPVDRALGQERQRIGGERRRDAADVAELAVQVDGRARPRRDVDGLQRRHAGLGQEAGLHRDRRRVRVEQQVERLEVRRGRPFGEHPRGLRRDGAEAGRAAHPRRIGAADQPPVHRPLGDDAGGRGDGRAEVLAGELGDVVGVERQALLRGDRVLPGDHLARGGEERHVDRGRSRQRVEDEEEVVEQLAAARALGEVPAGGQALDRRDAGAALEVGAPVDRARDEDVAARRRRLEDRAEGAVRHAGQADRGAAPRRHRERPGTSACRRRRRTRRARRRDRRARWRRDRTCGTRSPCRFPRLRPGTSCRSARRRPVSIDGRRRGRRGRRRPAAVGQRLDALPAGDRRTPWTSPSSTRCAPCWRRCGGCSCRALLPVTVTSNSALGTPTPDISAPTSSCGNVVGRAAVDDREERVGSHVVVDAERIVAA